MGTDTASFAIGSSTGQITAKIGVTYDYEAGSAYSLTVKATDGGGLSDSIAVTVSLTDVAETPVTTCETTVETLPAAAYAGAGDDAKCVAHHQDSRARYFHYTPSASGAGTISLTAGALYVSKGRPDNGWGNPPKGTYEHRKNVRRTNGKPMHDGPHVATPQSNGNTVTLSLAAGTTYSVEAAGASGDFTVSIRPQ